MLLSLDIAFANMGWAVFEKKQLLDFGVIRTEKTKIKLVRLSDDTEARASFLAKELNTIIDKYAVEAIIGELPSGSQNARAANQLGIALGIVASLKTLWGVPCEWITPRQLKIAITGKANGTKKEIMSTIRGLYKEAKFPKDASHFEHIADAISVYLTLKEDNLVKMYG